MKRVYSIALSLILGATMGAGISVQAQQAPQPQAQQQPAAQVSDQDVEAFANAIVAVDKIHLAYSDKIKETGNPDKAQALNVEASQKMVQAIEKEGLTPEGYNQMLQTIQQDPVLLQKVQQHLQSAQ